MLKKKTGNGDHVDKQSSRLILPPGAATASAADIDSNNSRTTTTVARDGINTSSSVVLGDKSGASKQEGMGSIYKAACIVPAAGAHRLLCLETLLQCRDCSSVYYMKYNKYLCHI